MLKLSTILADLPGTSRDLADLGLAILRNRAELVSVELAQERRRLIGMFIAAAFFIFFGLLAVVMISITVVFALEPGQRLWGLAGCSAAYLLLALAAGLTLRLRLRRAPRPFSQTLEELRKDREAL